MPPWVDWLALPSCPVNGMCRRPPTSSWTRILQAHPKLQRARPFATYTPPTPSSCARSAEPPSVHGPLHFLTSAPSHPVRLFTVVFFYETGLRVAAGVFSPSLESTPMNQPRQI